MFDAGDSFQDGPAAHTYAEPGVEAGVERDSALAHFDSVTDPMPRPDEGGVWSDRDGDGDRDTYTVGEHTWVDFDGDGELDQRSTDFDGDGIVDLAVTDLNGDGRIDVYAYDTDSDGLPDRIEADTDFDGRIDTVHYRDPDSNPYVERD